MIDDDDLKWLLYTPSGDANFISHLKNTNVETLKEALKSDTLTKGARKKIEVQLRKKEKE